jgi:hypothetical protein
MAAYNKFEPFVVDLAHGVHNLGSDQLKIALSNTQPTAGMGQLSEITQIAYTNLPGTTQPSITLGSSSWNTDRYDLVLDDLTITAGAGPVATFQFVIVYNDQAALDELICWFDYLGPVDLASGESLTIDFESNAGTDGSLLTLQ